MNLVQPAATPGALPGAPAHESGWRAPGSAHLIRANVRDGIPLARNSVDLIFTSFPYFRVREYEDDGAYMAGQIGDESTMGEYLENLWAVTAEMQRVLRPSGSIFVNEGDKTAERSGPGRNPSDQDETRLPTRRKVGRPNRINPADIRTKSLMGIPWRYALGCVDGRAGAPLILRAEIIWSKGNSLPTAPADRVRYTHEQIFHLTTRGRYYAAVDELREPHTGTSNPSGPNAAAQTWESGEERAHRTAHTDPEQFDPRGRLPGSVWHINSEPLTVPSHLTQHFAAFPQELARRIVLGWSPPGICLECDVGRWPAVAVTDVEDRRGRAQGRDGDSLTAAHGAGGRNGSRWKQSIEILGYACACTPHTVHKPTVQRDSAQKRRGSGKAGWHADDHQPKPRKKPWVEYHFAEWENPASTRPAVVCDPFCGTGTVPGVARALGRVGIGVDLSSSYLALARWRVFESGHFRKSVERTIKSRQGALL